MTTRNYFFSILLLLSVFSPKTFCSEQEINCQDLRFQASPTSPSSPRSCSPFSNLVPSVSEMEPIEARAGDEKLGKVKSESLKFQLKDKSFFTEELSKLLDFNSIVSASCGIDSLKKVGGWLNKHKNSLPFWPSVYIPPPKNLITFYGCDWTICEREVENQASNKLNTLQTKVLKGSSNSEHKNEDNNTSIENKLKGEDISKGDILNALSIWWCQKALPQLITDKETAFQTIFKEFSLPIVDQGLVSDVDEIAAGTTETTSNIDDNEDNLLESSSDDVKVSMIIPNDIAGSKDAYSYPNKLVFLKSALIKPIDCYILDKNKNLQTIKSELRELIDSERNRLESNLAFVLQIERSIWKTSKAFSILGKNIISVQRLIGTSRLYTEEIRRDFFKILSLMENNALDKNVNGQLVGFDDLEIIILEICRIQSITDAISTVTIKLIKRNKFSKTTAQDAEHLLMDWMFADMNISKSMIPNTKPAITRKSSPLFIDRYKRMKANGKIIYKCINQPEKD
ncbi:hypothetical protein FG386_002888 [Cryptosporidium ryanae]|uniref:uncharacterized protein n=1 Tax=Cryptosporidium ryanae TaxID=515981 RepID=UPI00351A9A28|nr:hypothetical protein FG386_002888 [Cryptosporidium ryanae]